MNKNLSELLAEARGAPIRYGEFEVRAIFELAVNERVILDVEFEKSHPTRAQGLHIKTESANLVANGISMTDAIFWTDTAPRRFEIVLIPTGLGSVAKVWNEWRDTSEVEHAWIGNAGLVVNGDAHDITLKCSDGVGDPTFEDLIVRIRIRRNVLDFASRRAARASGTGS